jgi:bifunctional lysine-specific demethylase and histidyl-hydroxylase NO66
MTLAALLGPKEWEEFRHAFRQRVTMVRDRSDSPDRFQSLWAEWELEAACRFTPAPHHEHFRLLIRGKKIPSSAFIDGTGAFREEAFRQLRASGASVAFGNFEDFSNIALALSRALEAEFKLPVQVNLYVTPGSNQGLGVHVDPHDVLILQIQGEKVWDIHEEGTESVSGPRVVTLTQGGWLFLPKGTRHEVRNRSSVMSVHFTLGFHPLTWGEIFQRALNRGRVASAVLNEPLPSGAAPEPTPAEMHRRLQSVLSFVDLPEFFTAYYGNFRALMVQVPSAGAPGREALEQLSGNTTVCWRKGAVLSQEDAVNPRVTLEYRRYPIELRRDCAAILRHMSDAGPFTVRQLPMKDKGAALLLVKLLVSLGVLSIEAS